MVDDGGGRGTFSIATRTQNGYTPLLLAASHARFDCARELLEYGGADTDATDRVRDVGQVA